MKRRVLLPLLAVWLASAAFGQDRHAPPADKSPAEKGKEKKDGEEKAAKEEKPPSVTRHQMTLGF